MSQTQISCPWCSEKVEISSGGWSQQRSQLMAHLLDCEKRPREGGISQLNIAADRILSTIRES